ncbi:MAG TPA: hypothetical protein VIM68_01835 [Thermoanaerobaculia bacterium]|jgi:hypothetical protein
MPDERDYTATVAAVVQGPRDGVYVAINAVVFLLLILSFVIRAAG